MATKSSDLSFEAQWPVPADITQVFTVGDTEYRFDEHSRLPFPVKQFSKDGVHVAISRGIATYDRMTALGLIPARPGYVAAVTTGPKAPKVVKVRLADGTVVEGTPVREPKPEAEPEPSAS
jgi:hypothetical protein